MPSFYLAPSSSASLRFGGCLSSGRGRRAPVLFSLIVPCLPISPGVLPAGSGLSDCLVSFGSKVPVSGTSSVLPGMDVSVQGVSQWRGRSAPLPLVSVSPSWRQSGVGCGLLHVLLLVPVAVVVSAKLLFAHLLLALFLHLRCSCRRLNLLLCLCHLRRMHEGRKYGWASAQLRHAWCCQWSW